MSLNINQFALSAQQGQMTLGVNLNVFSARVYASSVSTIIPGTALKIVDVAGNNIIVDKAAATDPIFGFAIFDPKGSGAGSNTWPANSILEVAIDNCVMFMTAGAGILQGASLEIVASSNKVITSAGTNKIIGIALKKAAVDGDLIPVLIKTPLINQVIGLSALPAISFLNLSDAPTSYSGAGLQNVRVNAGATGLEFHATTFLDLADTPDTYSGVANYTVKVNGGASALVFVNV